MGLIESLVLSVCISHSASTHQACTKGIQAAFAQSGAAEKTRMYEQEQTNFIERNVIDYVGKDNAEIVGGVFYTAKSASEKKIDITLPNMGICDKMMIEASDSKTLVLLKWSF